MLTKPARKITELMRKNGKKLLHHYLWPVSVHSRSFDFNYYYKKKGDDYLRVNLGAGPYFDKPGWISADFLPNFKDKTGRKVHVDLLKCLDKLPFENVGAYYISHTLEHFKLADSKRLLKSMYNSMRPGGFLRIIVPNADVILERVKANDLEYFAPMRSYFVKIDSKRLTRMDVLTQMLCQPMCRFEHLSAVEKDLAGIPKLSEDILSKDNNDIVMSLNNHNYTNINDGSFHLSCYTGDILCGLLKEAGFSKAYKSAFMQSHYGPMREVPLFDGTHPWMSLYVEAVK